MSGAPKRFFRSVKHPFGGLSKRLGSHLKLHGKAMMKTYSIKLGEIDKKWLEINADSLVVGRLAAIIATKLRGKHKAIFTPHMDCGDNVIVTNAAKVKFSGNKMATKRYYRHTGYPGGIKNSSAQKLISGRFPERVLYKAVQRMLPRGPLGRKQLRNLKIYPGLEHPHDAQKPQVVDIGALNSKNKRGG